VDFEEIPTFIEFVKIQEELKNLLGVKVDLLTEESISPFIKPFIKHVIEI
jgi:predicted nucleotidyltransferase